MHKEKGYKNEFYDVPNAFKEIKLFNYSIQFCVKIILWPSNYLLNVMESLNIEYRIQYDIQITCTNFGIAKKK